MSWIAWIVIGAIAGWLAEKIMKRDHSIFVNIIVGIIGGILGGWILQLFGIGTGSGWFVTLITAVVGACLLLWIVGLVTKPKGRV